MPHIVAIHQPNFFPWLGYFDKIRQADTFVFLDAVAYSRGSWTNRVRINIQGQAHWISCPLQRRSLATPINSMTIDDTQPWRRKLLRTLESNYHRSANFGAACMSLLDPLIALPEERLAAFNMVAIQTIAAALGLRCRFVKQSDLVVEGQATALLVAITQTVGGDTYLAGGGAGGYQRDELFEGDGIQLRYQNFVPHPYGPSDSYIPGLSVIDYLLHDGRPLEVAFPDGIGHVDAG